MGVVSWLNVSLTISSRDSEAITLRLYPNLFFKEALNVFSANHTCIWVNCIFNPIWITLFLANQYCFFYEPIFEIGNHLCKMAIKRKQRRSPDFEWFYFKIYSCCYDYAILYFRQKSLERDLSDFALTIFSLRKMGIL